jgi:two-component system invasion response regulator UvrY
MMPVRVLIVDDQESLRAVERAVIDLTEGFEVAGEVETGEASVDAARELRPDLILMDVNLPGISGLEATRRILAEAKEGWSVVVLLLSTYEAGEYATQATDAGADAFISKGDFSSERLKSAWETAAARK